MFAVLLLVPPVAPLPAIEHAADGNIPRIARHPHLAIIMLFAQMLFIKLKTLAFAFLIGMFVYRIFIIAQIFTGSASGECVTIRQPTGQFINHCGLS